MTNRLCTRSGLIDPLCQWGENGWNLWIKCTDCAAGLLKRICVANTSWLSAVSLASWNIAESEANSIPICAQNTKTDWKTWNVTTTGNASAIAAATAAETENAFFREFM